VYLDLFSSILILTFLALLFLLTWHGKGMGNFCALIIYKPLPLFCFRQHSCCGWRRATEFVIKCNTFNMQDTFILFTNNVISFSGSWFSGCTCLIQCDGWILLLGAQFTKSRCHWLNGNSWFLSCYQPRFVSCFMTATAENPVSH